MGNNCLETIFLSFSSQNTICATVSVDLSFQQSLVFLFLDRIFANNCINATFKRRYFNFLCRRGGVCVTYNILQILEINEMNIQNMTDEDIISKINQLSSKG